MKTYILFASSAILVASSDSVGAFTVPGAAMTTSSTSLQMVTVPLLGRFRRKREIADVKKVPIAVGDIIPEMDVEKLVAQGSSLEEEEGADSIAVPVSIREVCGTGSAVLVGMPGAFTPVCDSKHLPGYVSAASQLKNLGVDTVAVVTTNDKFVQKEWAKSRGVDDTKGVTLLCDADGDFVKEMGMAEDMGFGVGIRSKRFALLLQDGKVTNVLTDEGMEDCSATSADNVLAILTPAESKSELELDSSALMGVGGLLLLGASAYYLMSSGDAVMSFGAFTTTGSSSSFELLKQL